MEVLWYLERILRTARISVLRQSSFFQTKFLDIPESFHNLPGMLLTKYNLLQLKINFLVTKAGETTEDVKKINN